MRNIINLIQDNRPHVAPPILSKDQVRTLAKNLVVSLTYLEVRETEIGQDNRF